MSTEQLEERVAMLERAVAELQQKAAGPVGGPDPSVKWWEAVGRERTPEDEKAFADMVEYGRYWRRTGKDAPPDWKPGDPIPEPDFDQ